MLETAYLRVAGACKEIQGAEAYVMAGEIVLGAGVAQPYDQKFYTTGTKQHKAVPPQIKNLFTVYSFPTRLSRENFVKWGYFP
jgi:hypothetical protein